MYVFKSIGVCFFLLLTIGAAAAASGAGGEYDSVRQDSLPTVPEKPADRWLSADKGQHLLGSMILTIGTSRAYQRFVHTNETRVRTVGISFTFTLGAGKEAWDYFHAGHDASWKDLAADGVGILAGYFILLIK